MKIQFSVAEWAAWAPGLETRDAWEAWAHAPCLPQGAGTPALSEIAPMQRRRIDRLGRMAIQTAYWCQHADAEGIPLVFASRHGDVACSLALLESLSCHETLSPTSFGLSVHNAIAALYSIARAERGNYLALAAGQATPEAALVEAAGLLGDGAPAVLVVVYDAALPEIYADFRDEPDPFHAWCWRVVPVDQPGQRVRLSCSAPLKARDGQAVIPLPALLPHNLEVLRFLLAGTGALHHPSSVSQWIWEHEP